jgi:predicted DNA-binding antitoxin AbrB/MazE fold protein
VRELTEIDIVFKTFEKELWEDGVLALKPLERIDVSEGYAHPDEVNVIVANRNGSVLSASTILKSDLFTNLQKVSINHGTVVLDSKIDLLRTRCLYLSALDLASSLHTK